MRQKVTWTNDRPIFTSERQRLNSWCLLMHTHTQACSLYTEILVSKHGHQGFCDTAALLD